MIILIRTVILYGLIVFALRIMGKRQLGQLQPSEFVITILVSNIATLPIEDPNIPLVCGIIPILTLVSFEVIMSSITLKSKTARKIISGSPRVLIRDGVIDQQEMSNLRFSIDDLMEQLRGQEVFDVREIAFAVVETTGSLSIYKKFGNKNATAAMLSVPAPKGDDSPPALVINDGILMEQSLQYCNLKPEWLSKVLREEGYKMEDVFIMSCDRQAQYFIVPKEKKK